MSSGLAAAVNWSLPSWDLFIIIFFVLAILIYGMSLGRERVLAVLVSVYISLAITTNLPFINEKMSMKFGLGPVFVLQILSFFGCIAGIFFLLSRVGALSGFVGKPSIPVIALFSVLQVGLIISCVLSFLPPTALAYLSSMVRFAFASDIGRFLWILAPMGALYLIREKEPTTPEADKKK
ncbi:MAG: hypothetical protein PHN19_00170 [Patescibacteria group bacterium]|nr:hypothetical protein [Patescibacteria group bacterium]